MGGHGNRVNTPADGWSVIIHLNKGPAGISGCGTILFSFIFTRGQVSCQGKYFFYFLLFLILISYTDIYFKKITHVVKQFLVRRITLV